MYRIEINFLNIGEPYYIGEDHELTDEEEGAKLFHWSEISRAISIVFINNKNISNIEIGLMTGGAEGNGNG